MNMNLFEDMKLVLSCEYVSDLPKIFRADPRRFIDALLSLTFRRYAPSEWADMLNYMQISFTDSDLCDVLKIRKLLNNYISKTCVPERK